MKTLWFKRFLINFLIIFIGLTTIHSNAYARWATLEDMDVAIQTFNKEIKIKKDGTYEEIIEILAEPLKESGKDKLVTVPMNYNTRNAKLTILEAKTISEGQEFPVDLKNIEDKPLASSPQGFDQNNQILVAFPEISVNSKVYIKYRNTVHEAPIPGFYSTDFIYGMGQYCSKSHIHISSEIPLYIAAHDPEQYLEIKENKQKDLYLLDITLKKPIIKSAIDEQFVALNGKIYPWVTVSSLNQWSELGKLLVQRYEAVLAQPLPPLLEKIAKEANEQKTTIEKINLVTAKLAENLTYMGDWRTVKGAYIPRSLTEIVKSKLGDCKDFSATTTAILRKIGISADIALVNRGLDVYDVPNNLPNMYDFNHAFVRVKEGDKILWIDPTNFTSFAQGIFPDIAERKSLVLNPKEPELTTTRSSLATESLISLVKKIMLGKKESEIAEVKGEVVMSGVHALPLVGADLKASKDSINHDIIRSVADESRIIGWKIGDYNLTSRIVHDLNFKFDLTEKHTQIKTTAGKAFIVRTHDMIDRLLTKTEDRISDLQLDIPSTYKRELLLSRAALVGKMPNCSIESPWISGKRTITDTPEGIKVIDELIVKKNKILNSELKSPEYTKFQNEVYTCFGETALIYEKDQKN